MDAETIDANGALLTRVASGDARALERLHELHRPLAQGVAFRVLRDFALAEDAVQEGFLDLWRTAGEFDSRRSSMRAWLCVLVHRRAVDIARREASRRARDERDPPPPAASYTAEELLLVRFDRRRVQEALGQLPVPQRDLVELAYWGGLTQPELAERLELPLGTVKSRMFSALNVLRAALVLSA